MFLDATTIAPSAGLSGALLSQKIPTLAPFCLSVIADTRQWLGMSSAAQVRVEIGTHARLGVWCGRGEGTHARLGVWCGRGEGTHARLGVWVCGVVGVKVHTPGLGCGGVVW